MMKWIEWVKIFTVKFEDFVHDVSLSELDTIHVDDVALLFVSAAHNCQRTSRAHASVRACERKLRDCFQ